MISDFIKRLNRGLLPAKLYLMSLVDPVCWVIDKKAKTVLDLACGRGLPIRKIKSRMKIEHAVGVDLFKPYLKECQLYKLHNQYLCADIRKLPFKEKSFDVVLALQVLEHLHKRDSWKVLETLEKIAKKQVIISMPIGKSFHPAMDRNELQIHLSAFLPKELESRGYKTIKAGRKELVDENGGVVNKFDSDFLKIIIYAINIIIDALTLLFPSFATHYFVAYKNVSDK